MKYIREHARRHDVTPIITFDQPLWWKAQMIIVTEPVRSDLKDIILRLGGFPAEMSFLGCIGYLMAGSGLQEVLELIYASNAVVHMLPGKAIARAVRAHLIVDAALNALVLAKTFCVPPLGSSHDTECEDMETEEVESTSFHDEAPRNADLGSASVLYKKLMQGSMSAFQICQSDLMNKIRDALQTEAEALKSSRTAALWLYYMEMVDILRRFIRAERTGTGNGISNLSQKCTLTWQHLGTTTTQSLFGCICSECPICKVSIQMSISTSKKASMW